MGLARVVCCHHPYRAPNSDPVSCPVGPWPEGHSRTRLLEPKGFGAAARSTNWRRDDAGMSPDLMAAKAISAMRGSSRWLRSRGPPIGHRRLSTDWSGPVHRSSQIPTPTSSPLAILWAAVVPLRPPMPLSTHRSVARDPPNPVAHLALWRWRHSRRQEAGRPGHAPGYLRPLLPTGLIPAPPSMSVPTAMIQCIVSDRVLHRRKGH